MDNHKTSLERAFELASSGKYSNVSDIKVQIAKEGLDTGQVTGLSLSAQLRSLIKAAYGIKAS